MPELTRITRDPAVVGGKPCIRGMRVTVGTVVGLVAAGRTRDEILREYFYLEAEDIAEALSYAAWRAKEVEVLLNRDVRSLRAHSIECEVTLLVGAVRADAAAAVTCVQCLKSLGTSRTSRCGQ
jgi:uncharacterized protein (DUF433 family)